MNNMEIRKMEVTDEELVKWYNEKTRKMEVTDDDFDKWYNDQEFMKNVISVERDHIHVKGQKIPITGWIFTVKMD